MNNTIYTTNIKQADYSQQNLKPAAIVIRASRDCNNALSHTHDWIKWPIQTLNKTHQTAIRVLSSPNFIEASQEACRRFQQKKLQVMLIQAHGALSEEGPQLVLSNRSVYSSKDVEASHFQDISPDDGSVILQSCFSASLAETIAKKTNLTVYGFHMLCSTNTNLLIPSNSSKKYDFLAWDVNGDRNVSRFSSIEGQIKEEMEYGPSSEKIIEFCMKEASEGRSSAMFLLGEFFFHGKEVEQSLETSLNWYKKAALAGHSGGLKGLSAIVSTANPPLALIAIREMALLLDIPELPWYNEDKVLTLLKLASEKGDPIATEILAEKEVQKLSLNAEEIDLIDQELEELALEVELEKLDAENRENEVTQDL